MGFFPAGRAAGHLTIIDWVSPWVLTVMSLSPARVELRGQQFDQSWHFATARDGGYLDDLAEKIPLDAAALRVRARRLRDGLPRAQGEADRRDEPMTHASFLGKPVGEE